MAIQERDILAFHWPLLTTLCIVFLSTIDFINTNPWALLFLFLIAAGFLPAYIYAAIRIHKLESRPLKRFAWQALFLGIWPIGGPICYWIWLRNQPSNVPSHEA